MGGQWVGQVPEDLHVTGVNYYAGQVEPGDVVITTEPKTWRSSAYKNTNEIIQTFFDNKHAAVVVAGQLPANYRSDNPVLLVKNTREALDALGEAARNRIRGTVVAITGSAGKSTTKEITRFLLCQQGTTKGSRKNYNHGPGVPLMLAETPPDMRFGVYEFSVDLPNVTEKKASIIRPDIAMITNIHSDHLQFYGTLEKLTDQKCLLFKSLQPEGIVVLNHDATLFDRQLTNAKAANVKNIITFGTHEDADMKIIDYSLHSESSDVRVIFHKQEISFHVNQPGTHSIMNCLGALAAVHAAGGDWIKAAEDIKKAPVLSRHNEKYTVELASGDITLIDDTFSANPASVEAGLAVLGLKKPRKGGRRIAIMGEIKELGDTSAQLHAALAPHVIDAQVNVLFTVGRDLEGLWDALPKTMEGEHSEDPEHIAKAVVKEMHGSDILWVKGSRRSTANLEMILSAIKKTGKNIRKKSLVMNEAQEKRSQSQYKQQQKKRTPPFRTINELHTPSAFEVVFVGDTAFGENYQAQYESYGEENILKARGYDAPLAKVRNMLEEADLVVANLETPLTDLKVSPFAGQKSWVHWGDIKQTPRHLLANNISTVGLANNHMFDFGEEGFYQTLHSLEEAGITYFGGGATIDEAGEAFIAQSQIDGKVFTLAMISMYAGPSRKKDSFKMYASEKDRGLNPISFKRVRNEIKRVRKEYANTFVVLFPHWGPNYKWRSDRQARLAERMLKEGADLILGHGAHMIQEIEKHDNQWLIYSIGNFMFNSKGRYGKLDAPPYSAIAKLRVDTLSGAFHKSLHLYPIVTDNRKTDYQTRFVTEREFKEVVALLSCRYSDSVRFSNDVKCDKEESNEETRFYIKLPL
ncbi:CapA family protein [Desulfocapsa sulfexigens]|nr:CapA family protein [Desulfocapsa sulfexigens]